MSNVPSGSWLPPNTPGHPASPYPNAPGYPAAPTNPGASLGWRIGHSLWLIVPIVGFGCLSGTGHIYVGLRARRPAWWISGIVYTLLAWTSFLVFGESEKDSAVSNWGFGVFAMVWLASMLHAVLINPSWLRWRAGYRPWYAQPMPGQPWPGAGYPSGPLAPPPTSYDPYYGPGPVAAPVPQPGQPMTEAAPSAPPPLPTTPPPLPTTPPPLPTTPVDINSAGLDQLASLPGFDAVRAQNVLMQRTVRGGFGSVAEFAAVANLAPHEYARLRDLVVCAPPAAPGSGGPPSQGRVVDV